MEVRPQKLRAHVTASITPLFPAFAQLDFWDRFLDSLGLADERGEAAAEKNNARQYHNAASKAARRQGLKSSFATPAWLDPWPCGDNRVKSRARMCV